MRVLLCLSVVLGVWSMFAPTVRAEVKVGDEAPDFSLPGSDGKAYKMSDFKGKQALIIAWYPKAFTGG